MNFVIVRKEISLRTDQLGLQGEPYIMECGLLKTQPTLLGPSTVNLKTLQVQRKLLTALEKVIKELWLFCDLLKSSVEEIYKLFQQR